MSRGDLADLASEREQQMRYRSLLSMAGSFTKS